MPRPLYPDVTVDLTSAGLDPYVRIAATSRAIREAKGREASNEFLVATKRCSSYEDLLWLIYATVAVT